MHHLKKATRRLNFLLLRLIDKYFRDEKFALRRSAHCIHLHFQCARSDQHPPGWASSSLRSTLRRRWTLLQSSRLWPSSLHRSLHWSLRGWTSSAQIRLRRAWILRLPQFPCLRLNLIHQRILNCIQLLSPSNFHTNLSSFCVSPSSTCGESGSITHMSSTRGSASFPLFISLSLSLSLFLSPISDLMHLHQVERCESLKKYFLGWPRLKVKKTHSGLG